MDRVLPSGLLRSVMCPQASQINPLAPEPGLGTSLVQSARRSLSPVAMTKRTEPRELGAGS